MESSFSADIMMLPSSLPQIISQPQQAPGRLQLPSNNSNFGELWSLLSADIRKKFHKHLDELKKLARVKAQNFFLEQCCIKKVIPPTLQVKQNPDGRMSEQGKKVWFNNLKTLENNNLRLSLKESKLVVKKQSDVVEQSRIMLLFYFITEDSHPRRSFFRGSPIF